MKWMSKSWLLLLVAVVSLSMLGCADREEGEDNETYKMRNSINGTAWYLGSVKINGTWYHEYIEGTQTYSEDMPMWFEVKFSASNKTYRAQKFYYKDGRTDESTRREFKDQPYTINKSQVIAYTDDSKNTKFFTLNIVSIDSQLKGTITFHDENKTYDIVMHR